jgi:hypothetical protein
MSRKLVRLPLVLSFFLVLFFAVIASKAPIAVSHSEGSDAPTIEQARSAEVGVAVPSAGYASQQTANNSDHVLALAAHRFEPFMLFLLGSILLFIGSGMKLLLSRRHRRNPELLKER